MVVHHISHHDPGVTYHTIHVSTDFLGIHGTSKIEPEMVEFSPASRAGTYGIETVPGHFIGSSKMGTEKKKVQLSNPEHDAHPQEAPRGHTHS